MSLPQLEIPTWMPDYLCSRCPLCRSEFTLTFRRHHCRSCGTVVCDKCSNQKLFLPPKHTYTEPVRVCNPCNTSLREKGVTEKKPIGVITTDDNVTTATSPEFDSHY